MLRQCTCIVFIVQFWIVNKRLLDNDKSIWKFFLYVFKNNIPRCAPMGAESTCVCSSITWYLRKNGATSVTGDVPRGLYSTLGRSHRLSRTTVRSVWLNYCEDGRYEPRPKKGVGAGRQGKLNDGDLFFFQSILKEKPSTSYSEIAEKPQQYSVTGRVLKQCLSHYVRNYLPSGKFSFKRITREMGDKYNQNNMNYY